MKNLNSLVVLLSFGIIIQFSDAFYQRDKGSNPFFHSSSGPGVPTPYERAMKVLNSMDINDKIAMVHGSSGPYVGDVVPNSPLGIPPLTLEDGPQGVADGVTEVTCWPSALTVVASWDPNMIYTYSSAMALEQRMKGTSVMLGPMINIARVPMGGRNFESFGEDPCLTSNLVVPSVLGIQSQGVIACAKHFINNNQEYNRTLTSANVDERTQWEIYYPGFQAAIDAGVGSIMCSYNRINNTYACENEQTLNVDLKGRMGFEGWVMSDWGATHSTVPAANNGLDQQMPDDYYFGNSLLQAVQNGDVTMERLDDMVLRILVPMFAIGIIDNPPALSGNLSVNVMSNTHNLLSRQLAEAGTVLLKNDNNILPIQASTVKSIAVLGDDGSVNPVISGYGSGHVISSYVVTPLQGLMNLSPSSSINITYAPTNPISIAVNLAKEVDLAIVFVSTDSSEGIDRTNLSLDGNQDELISAVAQVQPNTIVVIHTPGAVLMPWLDDVAAVVCAFLPGQEDGNAIANILYGNVNPGGKLPVTFPPSMEQIPVNTELQYPGIDNEAYYSEKLLVGYRWFDAMNVEPLFPFGHGLSYTTFEYSNIEATGSLEDNFTISFQVENTGDIYGSEVPQLYVGYPPSAGEPPKVMRAFEKVFLNAGSSQSITFTLTPNDLSIWSIELSDYSVVNGLFNIYIGSSSRDIRLTTTITVN